MPKGVGVQISLPAPEDFRLAGSAKSSSQRAMTTPSRISGDGQERYHKRVSEFFGAASGKPGGFADAHDEEMKVFRNAGDRNTV